MAVTKGNGFPFRVQPAHLCFVSIPRSIPLRVAHPPPVAESTEPVCPRTSDLDCVEDCLSRRTYQLPNSRLLCRRKDI
jgi:hypothetical protein